MNRPDRNERSSDPVLEHGWPCIAVRSRKNAMDWSLMLASQGIPSIINGPESSQGWSLGIRADQIKDARDLIRQYEQENRSIWRYRMGRHSSRRGKFGLHFGCLIWAACLILFHMLQTGNPDLVEKGIMSSHSLSTGEWWRLITATWLHADTGHLAGNLTMGTVLVGIALFMHGPGLGFLVCQLTGTLANAGSYLIQSDTYRSLGASGVVLGTLGILTVDSFKAWRTGEMNRKQVFGAFAGGIMLFTLMGFSPGSDWVVHTAGFMSGILIGWLVGWIPDRDVGSTRLQTASLCLGIAMVLTAWVRALQLA